MDDKVKQKMLEVQAAEALYDNKLRELQQYRKSTADSIKEPVTKLVTQMLDDGLEELLSTIHLGYGFGNDNDTVAGFVCNAAWEAQRTWEARKKEDAKREAQADSDTESGC